MEPEEIRLECLRLAKERAVSVDETVETARKFADFVSGKVFVTSDLAPADEAAKPQ